ncbi:hypothetical protein O3P69_008283 [Scylla paramamosain]|uniref:C2H2-type domain-containing protein n=1 Tax=Scylla paramamosain TaxID=85552 RepID=A0AAW0SAS2_SCYPA
MGTALPRRLGKIGPMRTRHSSRYPSLPSPGKPVFILPRHCWGVTSRRVYNAVDRVNPTGTPRADRRGKHVPKHAMPLSRKNLVECHIKSFPTVSSHYTRAKSPLMRYLDTEMTMKKMYFLYKEWLFDNHEDEEPVTFSYYKKVVQGFRLGFKPPSTDTCSKCDRYEVSKKDANTEEEAQGIQAQWDEHLSFAKEGMKQELDNTEEDDSTEDEDEDHLEYDSDSEDIVDDPPAATGRGQHWCPFCHKRVSHAHHLHSHERSIHAHHSPAPSAPPPAPPTPTQTS